MRKLVNTRNKWNNQHLNNDHKFYTKETMTLNDPPPTGSKVLN